MAERPRPPQPTGGVSCDWGNCSTPAAGWRWYKAMRKWLPVCNSHSGGTLTRRSADYVPDWANVPREGDQRA